MKRIIPLFLILIFGTLFAVLLLNPTPIKPAGIQTLKTLAFRAPGAEQPIDLQIPNPGIVNVFASWCIPCVAEMPLLADLQKTDIPIFGLAYKDNPEALQGFLAKHGNPYKSVMLDDGSMAAQLGVTGVPESFLVDAQGRVVRHMAGMLDATQLADWQAEIATWH